MIKKSILLSTMTLATALTSVFSPMSHAGPATYLSSDASRCEIFRSLSRDIPGDCALVAYNGNHSQKSRTRGLVLHDADGVAAKKVVRQEPKKQMAIAMRVEFEFDSFELTADARETLDRVAAVLNHELMTGKRVRIEGHADASGSETYNLSLSQQRARAVRAYLVEERSVDASRLTHVGKGEIEPYDPRNPEAGINRRVEFRNLSQ